MTRARLVEELRLALTLPSLRWTSGAADTAADRVSPTSAGSARLAVLAAPLVGAVLAAIAGGVMLAARYAYAGPAVYIKGVRVEYLEAPIVAAALAVVTVVLLTRGRQLDGLARVVDELTGGAGRGGNLGVLTLVCCLLLDVLALGSSVLAHHGTQSLVFAIVTGRLAMVWACTPGTPGRPGDETAVRVARTVPWAAAACWTLVVVAGAATYGRYDSEVGSPHGAVRGAIAVLVALAASWLLKRSVVRRLGGISGASLGALCEIATVVSLLVTAAGRP